MCTSIYVCSRPSICELFSFVGSININVRFYMMFVSFLSFIYPCLPFSHMYLGKFLFSQIQTLTCRLRWGVLFLFLNVSLYSKQLWLTNFLTWWKASNCWNWTLCTEGHGSHADLVYTLLKHTQPWSYLPSQKHLSPTLFWVPIHKHICSCLA